MDSYRVPIGDSRVYLLVYLKGKQFKFSFYRENPLFNTYLCIVHSLNNVSFDKEWFQL
jgi:hypothetical protein